MSGGSMNYLYSKLEYEANFREDTPERRAFAKHLKLVAKALHDIEWVESGDYGPGDDAEAIRACLSNGATLEAAVDAAHEARKTYERSMCPHEHAVNDWRLHPLTPNAEVTGAPLAARPVD